MFAKNDTCHRGVSYQKMGVRYRVNVIISQVEIEHLNLRNVFSVSILQIVGVLWFHVLGRSSNVLDERFNV